MPPALSDSEVESSDEQVPPQKKGKQQPIQAPPEEDSAEEDDDDEAGPDEYIVEKILGHKFVKGELVFNVKWQGYENPKDRTWEPESNMDGAADVLNEYFDEIGGRPEPKTGQKRKGRASEVNKSEPATPASSAPPKRAKKEWSPPPGSWEHDVSHIDTVEEGLDPKSGAKARFAYLVWNNKKKTQHPLKHVYQKCPQKMLEYYESHLVFRPGDDINGQDEGNNISMNDAY